MSTKKKGILSVHTEWWKHLRKFGKRLFWSKHRLAERKEIKRQLNDQN